MEGSLVHRAAVPTWTAWALLGASAAPLAFALVEVQRLLLGSGPAFLRAGDEPPSTYLRASYLLQTEQPDRVLLVVLLGLAVAAWLLRTGPVAPRPDLARTCAAVLTGVLAALTAGLLAIAVHLATSGPPDDGSDGFSTDDRLHSLGAPAAAALVLAVLSVLLLRLVLAERAQAQPTDDATDDPPDDGPVRLSLDDGAEPGPGPEQDEPDRERSQRDDAVPVHLVEEPPPRPPAAAPDAHSVFRRPEVPQARPSGPVPVAAPLSDSSAYRRPASADHEPADDPHAPYRRASPGTRQR